MLNRQTTPAYTHEHAVRLLFAAYGPTPPTDLQMGAYLLAVVDLPPDDVFSTVVELIRGSVDARAPQPPAAVRAHALHDNGPPAAADVAAAGR